MPKRDTAGMSMYNVLKGVNRYLYPWKPVHGYGYGMPRLYPYATQNALSLVDGLRDRLENTFTIYLNPVSSDIPGAAGSGPVVPLLCVSEDEIRPCPPFSKATRGGFYSPADEIRYHIRSPR
jgi:hypothetical protein